ETSAVVRARVRQARDRQLERQGKANALLETREIDQHCLAEESALSLLKQAIRRFELSARAYHRLLKISRTAADLEGCDRISSRHVAEAVQFRRFTKE
ncbi:MAG TPA: ATP-dependent protease, partial [Accumulibacter sp.]|nr:ATP-dependent protease [Accumulibacter sp.]